MNQVHPAARKRQRIGQIDPVEGRAERQREIASSQCINLDLIEPRRATAGSRRRIRRRRPWSHRHIERSRDDSLAGGQLLRREEAREPSRIVKSGSPATVASNWKRNKIVFP